MGLKLAMASEVLPPEEGEAEGCIQCQKGSKMVLFVTGRCHWGCDYCPLSDNRRETPDMFANERRCSNWEEVVEEAKAMRATGTGITGGDPMLDFEKTIDAIKILKKEMGADHHIHCYTSIPVGAEKAKELAVAGLDEIRFHLLDLTIDRYLETIESGVEHGMEVGVELPVEPDKEPQLFALLEQLENSPVSFLNLNELEITIGNQENMDVRGFNLAGGITAAAEGSADLALRMKESCVDKRLDVKFCTSTYKDAGQLRNRFRRRGLATLRPYEMLSDDDTIVFGAILTTAEHGDDDLEELQSELNLADGWIRYDNSAERIEIPLSLAENLAEHLEVAVVMVEIHPTHDRLEVGMVHLNTHR